jgi:hypothetical protein
LLWYQGAENNNKPGVKLPSVVSTTSGSKLPVTILESVIKQTGVYASSRKGRLSVFWGDQVFIPSVSTRYTSSYHADILAQMGPMPSKEEWEAGGYSNYGLIAMGAAGEGAQVEKVSYEQATELLKGLGELKEVGPSLGSFSVSSPLLGGLLKEFKHELGKKEIALDSDPHFWMPMTLSLTDYVAIMGTKKTSAGEATAHYHRIQKLKNALPKTLGVFGAVGVGKDGYWWDYGQVRFYQDNNLIMAQESAEGDAMRKFFNVPASSFVGQVHRNFVFFTRGIHAAAASSFSSVVKYHSFASAYFPAYQNQTASYFTSSRYIVLHLIALHCATYSQSTIVNSTIGPGSNIEGSVLTGVTTPTADLSGALLVNVTAPSITGRNCVAYNVVTDEPLHLEDGEVLVGMQIPGAKYIIMKSHMSRDGKDDWKQKHRCSSTRVGVFL